MRICAQIFVVAQRESVKSSSTRLTFRYHTGIHECGQREIGNHEKCYDTLIRRHPWMTENIILASSW